MARNTAEGTEATRVALLDAGRSLFVERGYADTATPEIVARAAVTRGALYHHFSDKRALFNAVVGREALAVAKDIEARSADAVSPRDALLQGASAYFDAMAVPGRTKLLLREAPALLGDDPSESTLKSGLSDLLLKSPLLPLLDPLTEMLSAAFDRAAIAIDAGGDRKTYEAAIAALLDGLADPLGR